MVKAEPCILRGEGAGAKLGAMKAAPLVLGSTSRYRRELLERLGVPFSQAAPTFDERTHDARFGEVASGAFALELAVEKARSIAVEGGERWLLCADQVGVLTRDDGSRQMLTKPETPERCVEQLMELAGRTHALVNGIVLFHEGTGRQLTTTDRQELTMRAFGRDEAEAYVRDFAPLDCAGGYRIEDAGIRLFERIQSDDFTGIIGLPLLSTARLLREAGLLLG